MSAAFGMLVTFLFMWHGRDKVWTPTFEGTREERFIAAARHYEGRMGLAPATILLSDQTWIIDGKERCAWAWRSDAWADDGVALSRAKRCKAHKPELLALHEQCHRRMAHLEPGFWGMDPKRKEREADDCMVAYSAKERR